MRRDEIAALKREFGPRGVVCMVADLLEGVKLPNGVTKKLRPEQFSLRHLWEGFVGDPEETLPNYRGGAIYIEEAVDSSAFAAVTRLLLANKVIDAYNQVPGVGDSLVSTMASSRRIETIAGFSNLEGMKDVPEGMNYEDSSFDDKYITTQALKRGRLLSITEEAIMEDQTGQLLMRAGQIGEIAKQDREKTIIYAIVDKNGNVWRPSGTATALYSTANGNLCGTGGAISGFTSAMPLVDWQQLESVEVFHSRSITDDRKVGAGEPILWNPNCVFVPKALNTTALRIRNALEVRVTTGGSNQNRTTFTNPKANAFDVVTSPFVQSSGLTNNDVDWYYGDFKRQFFWQDIWPIQVFRQDNNGPEAFARDIVAVFKVRYLGGVFALDNKYVIKVKGA